MLTRAGVSVTAIPGIKYPIPSELGSQTTTGVVSTAVGDHAGIRRVVTFFFDLFFIFFPPYPCDRFTLPPLRIPPSRMRTYCIHTPTYAHPRTHKHTHTHTHARTYPHARTPTHPHGHNSFTLPHAHANTLAHTLTRALSLTIAPQAGCAQHFSDVFLACDADAALAAGIFHRGEVPIAEVKAKLELDGIDCRQT